jgi:4-methylaminobutanoate oxidase (formaldehyde-forming)
VSQGNAPEVIVGAGILGCALARELMRRGRRPGELLVIDPNPVASQATARAAALLSLARPWQKAHWIPLVRRTLTAIDVLRDEGFFIPLERCGAVHLAASDAARAILADQQATAVLSDVSCSVVAPTDFAREMPWLHCAAFEQALWFSEEAYADPYLLACAYEASARRRGARFMLGEAARLEGQGDRVRVRAGGAAWVPERLWIAAGAWTNALLAPLGCAAPFVPVRSQYWITEHTELAPAGMPIVIAPDLRLYARRELSAVLFGLRESPGAVADPRSLPRELAGYAFDGDETKTGALEAALDPLNRLAPRLVRLGLKHYVSGPSGYSPDGEFAVGPCARWDNLTVLGGCNGAGIAVSAGLAQFAADLSEGCADPDLVRRFDPGRFAYFDPFSVDWQDRCAAARAAKLSG